MLTSVKERIVQEKADMKALIDLFDGLYDETHSVEELRDLFNACPQKNALSHIMWIADGACSEDPIYGESKILENPKEILRALTLVTKDSLRDHPSLVAIAEAFETYQESALGEIRASVRSASLYELKDVFIQSAKNGDLSFVKFLVNSGRVFSDEYLGSAVEGAARGGHLEVVQFLLSGSRTISEKTLGNAVYDAAERGHLEVVQFLLSEGRTISERDLGDVVIGAARAGHLEVVRFILSEGRSISERDLGSAFFNARTRGHSEIVRFLLSDGRTITHISRRSSLVMLCAQRGWADIVERLLQSGPIFRSNQNSALGLASGPQRDQIIEILNRALIIEDHLAHAGMPHDPASLTIPSLSHVEENPLTYLDYIISKGRLPSRIFLQGSTAVDLGGLSREFITRIYTGLVKQKASDAGLEEEPILPFYGDTGLAFIKDGTSEELLKKLGALFSILHAYNHARSDKAVTGTVFSPLFFKVLKQIALSKTDDELVPFLAEILESVEENGLSSYAKLIREPDNEEVKQAIADALGIDKEDTSEVAKDELLQVIQRTRAFFEGTSACFKGAIASSEPEDLCNQMQGEDITKEKLCAALALTEAPSEDMLLKFEWLKEKINTSDDAFRKAFLQMITGQTTLKPSLAIRLDLTHRPNGGLFEAHTCFNSLDLPRTVMDKEMFFQALDAVISASGYNIA